MRDEASKDATKRIIKKILIPSDGSLNSVRGLNEALYLARLGSSRITGIHALPICSKNSVGTFDTYVTYKSKLDKDFLEKVKISAARHGIKFS